MLTPRTGRAVDARIIRSVDHRPVCRKCTSRIMPCDTRASARPYAVAVRHSCPPWIEDDPNRDGSIYLTR